MAKEVEKDKDFKDALSVIKELEDQLVYFSDKDHFMQEKERMKKEIETSFESFVQALEERKSFLLNKLDDLFQNTEKENEESVTKTASTLVASRKLLKAGMRTYEISQVAGTSTFKNIQHLKPPALNRNNINVYLPDTLLATIQSYGEVSEKHAELDLTQAQLANLTHEDLKEKDKEEEKGEHKSTSTTTTTTTTATTITSSNSGNAVPTSPSPDSNFGFAFGKTSNFAFGNNSVFGAPSSVFGSSVFGSPSSSNSVFGSSSPAFGASSNSVFGSPSSSNSVFGSSSPAFGASSNSVFGAPSSSNSVFGSSSPAFGASSNSVFGAPSSSKSIFGSPSSSNSVFGAPSPAKSVFGPSSSSNSVFGSSPSNTPPSGSNTYIEYSSDSN